MRRHPGRFSGEDGRSPPSTVLVSLHREAQPRSFSSASGLSSSLDRRRGAWRFSTSKAAQVPRVREEGASGGFDQVAGAGRVTTRSRRIMASFVCLHPRRPPGHRRCSLGPDTPSMSRYANSTSSEAIPRQTAKGRVLGTVQVRQCTSGETVIGRHFPVPVLGPGEPPKMSWVATSGIRVSHARLLYAAIGTPSARAQVRNCDCVTGGLHRFLARNETKSASMPQ